jgi:hypothetical protein
MEMMKIFRRVLTMAQRASFVLADLSLVAPLVTVESQKSRALWND